jgi:hypothetical protein
VQAGNDDPGSPRRIFGQPARTNARVTGLHPDVERWRGFTELIGSLRHDRVTVAKGCRMRTAATESAIAGRCVFFS